MNRFVDALAHRAQPNTPAKQSRDNVPSEAVSSPLTPSGNQVVAQLALQSAGQGNGMVATVETMTGDGYSEIVVDIMDQHGVCRGSVIVGLDPNLELCVSMTTDGFGDGDKNIAAYPMRPAESALEVDVRNSQFSRPAAPK